MPSVGRILGVMDLRRELGVKPGEMRLALHLAGVEGTRVAGTVVYSREDLERVRAWFEAHDPEGAFHGIDAKINQSRDDADSTELI